MAEKKTARVVLVAWRNMRKAVTLNRPAGALLIGVTLLLGVAPVAKSLFESALLSAFSSFARLPVHGWGDFLSFDLVTLPTIGDILSDASSSERGSSATIGVTLVLYLALVVVVWLLQVLSTYASSRISKRYFVGLQLDGWRAALDADPKTENKVRDLASGRAVETDDSTNQAGEPLPGFYSKAVQDGAAAVANATVNSFTLVQNAVTFVVALWSVRVLGWNVVAAFIIVIGVAVTLNQIQTTRLSKAREEHERRRSELNARTTDVLEHRDLIRAWEQTENARIRLEDVADTYAECDAQLDVASTRYQEAISGVYDVGRIVVVAIFAVYVGVSTNSTFDVFFASTLYLRLLSPLNSFVSIVQSWARARSNSAIFWTLINQGDTKQSKSQQSDTDAPPAETQVRFENVTFSYPGDLEPTLSEISFDIPKGKTTLLVGRSGSGKTTIARLMMGFLELEQCGRGNIWFEGRLASDYTRKELLAKIDYVSQAHDALHGSIRENLFPDPGVQDAELIDRLRRVRLSQYSLDSEATELSHGQKQRLSVARLLDRGDVGLTVLDEPVTGLDAFTMAEIYGVLRSEVIEQHRTVLIISHRLIFAKLVDHVVTLDEDADSPGGIRVEQGRRSDLLRSDSAFRRLYLQALAELDGLNPEDETVGSVGAFDE